MVQEHWCSSGFSNTDLDMLLEARHPQAHRHSLMASTCVQAIVRFAAELGYEVTVVRDAIVNSSDEKTHASLGISTLKYASVIVSTREMVETGSTADVIGNHSKCFAARDMDGLLVRLPGGGGVPSVMGRLCGAERNRDCI